MSRRSIRPPKFCHHTSSGQAVVYLNRQPVYLGKFESPESFEEYARVVAEWSASVSVLRDREKPLARGKPPVTRELTINQLLLAYFQRAKTYYADTSGEVTSEYQSRLYAAKPLRKLYGRALVSEFGPKRLKALRIHLIDQGTLCRQVINRRVNRIKRIFKWAVSVGNRRSKITLSAYGRR